MTENPARTRLDKWLWQARFCKTRALSARLVAAGHVRVNGRKVAKPAQAIGPGNVLTFPQANRVRVIRILALATRRGPPAEARALYEDLAPAPPAAAPAEPRPERGGRPTKRDRRKLDLRRSDTLD